MKHITGRSRCRDGIIIFCLMISGLCVKAQQITIDNQSPCPGDWITFTFPTSFSSCTGFKVVSQNDINISPLPPSPIDNVIRGYSGATSQFTYVSVRYPSYHSNLISVNVDGTCAGGGSGTAYATSFYMKSPLSSDPTISGLDDNIYKGDSQSTASVSNAVSGAAYSWQLIVVSTTEGSITSGAIATPSSSSTQINWPSGFVGDVDIKVTATSCNTSRTSTKRVNVKYAPYHSWNANSTPAVNCSGVHVPYGFQLFGGFTLVSASLFLGGNGNAVVPGSGSTTSSSAGWSVEWIVDGNAWVTYKATDGTRFWDITTQHLPFDVREFNGGQISVTQPTQNCSPVAITVVQNTNPSDDYVWQYCNTGDCNASGAVWTNNSPSNSATFNSLSANTSFRIKLTETRCGDYASNVVGIAVKPTPIVLGSDLSLFSGGSFNVPSTSMAGAQVTVTLDSSGVKGASGFSGFQGDAGVSMSTQVLTTTGSNDGVVTYSIQGAYNQCFSEYKNITVQVYKTPKITSNPKAVYRGLQATLSTGGYDSYVWKNDANATVSNTSTYQTGIPGKYKVIVTKNGVQGTSEMFFLGRRLETLNQNFIVTRQPLKEFASSEDFEDKPALDVMESINYFDALGRPSQNIGTRMSPSELDVVEPIAYDNIGRETKKYLPYVSFEDNGRYQPNPLDVAQSQFYLSADNKIASDSVAYAESVFDNSPLNRITQQGAAGKAWQPGGGHAVKKDYLTNEADKVLQFVYSYDNGLESTLAYYPAHSLFCNKTTDEQQHVVLEYVDKEGRTICKKVDIGNGVYASTYYVYDLVGNLVVVLPPEAVKLIEGN